jgi:predicted choloylglycine hydrolase
MAGIATFGLTVPRSAKAQEGLGQEDKEEIRLKPTIAHYLNHSGTNYEIGQRLGNWVSGTPVVARRLEVPPGLFAPRKQETIANMLEMFDKYCPGINEEIEGFADAVGVDPTQVLFYQISYLVSGCNAMALRPEKNFEGHTILAYTYDFTDILEEMCLATTNVTGRYSHTGSQCNIFGRANGINEHGLALCQSSNGLPVTNIKMGLDPVVTGLHFWCVIRALLENCRNVSEALTYIEKMPISYNMNLVMGDTSGDIVLFENLNGFKVHKIVKASDPEGFLCASNHAVLPEMLKREKMRWRSSVQRHRTIRNTFASKPRISKEDIKKLISTKYPEGLCTHFYDMQNMFGMLYGGILDVNDKTIDITFGTPQCNPWRKFEVGAKYQDQVFEVSLPYEQPPKDFYEMTEETV